MPPLLRSSLSAPSSTAPTSPPKVSPLTAEWCGNTIPTSELTRRADGVAANRQTTHDYDKFTGESPLDPLKLIDGSKSLKPGNNQNKPMKGVVTGRRDSCMKTTTAGSLSPFHGEDNQQLSDSNTEESSTFAPLHGGKRNIGCQPFRQPSLSFPLQLGPKKDKKNPSLEQCCLTSLDDSGRIGAHIKRQYDGSTHHSLSSRVSFTCSESSLIDSSIHRHNRNNFTQHRIISASAPSSMSAIGTPTGGLSSFSTGSTTSLTQDQLDREHIRFNPNNLSLSATGQHASSSLIDSSPAAPPPVMHELDSEVHCRHLVPSDPPSYFRQRLDVLHKHQHPIKSPNGCPFKAVQNQHRPLRDTYPKPRPNPMESKRVVIAGKFYDSEGDCGELAKKTSEIKATGQSKTRTQLAALQQKIVEFEGQLQTHSDQKKIAGEGRLNVLKEALGALEQALASEVRRRVDANRATQSVRIRVDETRRGMLVIGAGIRATIDKSGRESWANHGRKKPADNTNS